MSEKDTILLIEDSDDYRDLLSELLGPFFNVEEAPTLAHGLAKLQERAYFAVLLDLNLPDSLPSATLPTAIAKAPAASIVIVSANADPAVVAQMILSGASGYLVKGKHDLDGPQLYRAIRDAVQQARIESRMKDTTQLIRKIEGEFKK